MDEDVGCEVDGKESLSILALPLLIACEMLPTGIGIVPTNFHLAALFKAFGHGNQPPYATWPDDAMNIVTVRFKNRFCPGQFNR